MSDYPNEREQHNDTELSIYGLIRLAMDLEKLNSKSNQLGSVRLKAEPDRKIKLRRMALK